MGYRTLDLNVISATGLKNATDKDVYAVVSFEKYVENYKSSIHKNGGSDPEWNHRLRINVYKEVTLVIKIKAVRKMFIDKKLGELKVPIKELLKGVTSEGKHEQFVSYELKHKKGVVKFSYKFGEEIVKKKRRSSSISSSSGDELFGFNFAFAMMMI